MDINFINVINNNEVNSDYYLPNNKKILVGGFKNNIYNYKYIKYKTKYNNLKMLLKKI